MERTKTQRPKVETQTLRIQRVIRAPKERVYNAFLEADALAKWLPPNGYAGRVHQMEPKVGGAWRMSFSSLDKKDTHSFGGTYLELDPFDRIRFTDNFDPPLFQTGADIIVSVTFTEAPGGTEVSIVQEGLPKSIPLGDAQKGWGQSLENLARLVELGSDQP